MTMLLEYCTAWRNENVAASCVSWMMQPGTSSASPDVDASKRSSGAASRSSSVAPLTTTLKVEPGSY